MCQKLIVSYIFVEKLPIKADQSALLIRAVDSGIHHIYLSSLGYMYDGILTSQQHTHILMGIISLINTPYMHFKIFDYSTPQMAQSWHCRNKHMQQIVATSLYGHSCICMAGHLDGDWKLWLRIQQLLQLTGEAAWILIIANCLHRTKSRFCLQIWILSINIDFVRIAFSRACYSSPSRQSPLNISLKQADLLSRPVRRCDRVASSQLFNSFDTSDSIVFDFVFTYWYWRDKCMYYYYYIYLPSVDIPTISRLFF